MKPSNVYFTDMRCDVGTSLLTKLDTLIRRAGMDDIDFDSKYTAIKIHFGEEGNLSFLRPNFARTVVERVKALGGRPFLTDCNTLYVGRRRDALDHLSVAAENGFSPASTGCQILIGDGLKGNDDIEVPVKNGKHFTSARIGRVVYDADILISLNHFKGHENTGFGGAIKNLGMGCGSRPGKMQMHHDGKPIVHTDECTACGICFNFCAEDAIQYDDDGKASIDHERCVGCGRCVGVCNFNAIENVDKNEEGILSEKMAEYAQAAINARPNFHISIVNQVSPYCDCHGENDAPVVPDIGMFASFDPVALDKACIDAVNVAPGIQSSILSERDEKTDDHFTNIHPGTDWRTQLSHAEAVGLGTQAYKLITVG